MMHVGLTQADGQARARAESVLDFCAAYASYATAAAVDLGNLPCIILRWQAPRCSIVW